MKNTQRHTFAFCPKFALLGSQSRAKVRFAACAWGVAWGVLSAGHLAHAAPLDGTRLVHDARKQIGVTVSYDPAYRKLAFPMGDVEASTGVCTDVVVRAYRQQGVDLQALVNADMRGNFALYPKQWGLRAPDHNIDHRRVPNLQVFFTRHGQKLPLTQKASDYQAGDLVTWMLPGNLPHIGIVSQRRSAKGVPLIIHNIGRGTQEEDVLFNWRMTGHYRYRPELRGASQRPQSPQRP